MAVAIAVTATRVNPEEAPAPAATAAVRATHTPATRRSSLYQDGRPSGRKNRSRGDLFYPQRTIPVRLPLCTKYIMPDGRRSR